jgi:hypothetical protein
MLHTFELSYSLIIINYKFNVKGTSSDQKVCVSLLFFFKVLENDIQIVKYGGPRLLSKMIRLLFA